MRHLDPRAWMLTEAIELLHNADRLQRQFFQLGYSGQAPCWEPPVDMYQSGRELGLLIALPGVAPEQLEVTLEAQAIVVRGARAFCAGLGPGAIIRLEIPYGRFERRVGLPDGDYRLVDSRFEHGCLRLQLRQFT